MNGLLTAKELAQHLGITKQAVMKRAEKEGWPFQNGNGKGGSHRNYPLASLPPDIQKMVVAKQGAPASMLAALAPEAALEVVGRFMPVGSFAESLSDRGGLSLSSWTPETAISEKDLRDPRVRRILAIIREAEAMPRTWTQGRRRWIESVATRHDCSFQAVYRWLDKYEKRGIAGIVHTKSTREKPRAWSPEAIDFWIGLALKKQHRKVDLRALYTDALAIEAQRRGWRIGTYESARWWYDRRVTPQLLALQKGGLRALDNVLPPVLRDYSDLQPFEMLVGDQHRFDFWVIDDDTGEVFRPEGYFWQDLRTRILYGAAIDHRYDAWLIGLALRVGIAIFGAFGSIYTDNGRPELSRYLAGILADMRALGLEWERTLDVPVDVLDVEAEDVHPAVIVPGTHRKAIVKNAKAKMIEGTFDRIEQILRSRFKLAGSTKRLTDDIHH
jgi:putative transposase